MRRTLPLTSLLLALAFVVAAPAADEKKDDADKKPAAEAKKDADKKPDADDAKKDEAKKPDAAKKEADKKPADDKKDADKKTADDKKEAEKKAADAKKKDTEKKAEGKDKPEAAKIATKKPPAEPKLVTGAKISGKITVVEGSTKNFTVQVSRKFVVPNPSAMAAAQGQIIQALRNPNPFQRMQQIAQAKAQMASAYSVQEQTFPVEFQAADDIKVRLANPPVEYDDKGKPKRYTAKELKEMKGTDNLPGFPADFESLRTDQIVDVYLPPKKKEPYKPMPVRAKDKDKDKDDWVAEKQTAILVIVVAELKK